MVELDIQKRQALTDFESMLNKSKAKAYSNLSLERELTDEELEKFNESVNKVI